MAENRLFGGALAASSPGRYPRRASFTGATSMLESVAAPMPESCFRRLHALLEGVEPPPGVAPIHLHVGDPQHAPPAFALERVAEAAPRFGRYAPTGGTPELRTAIADWLRWRYHLPQGMLDPARHVLPVAGIRESMFLGTLLAMRDGSGRPGPAAMAIPNPFYHCYLGAAVTLGAEPVMVPAGREQGFLPDLDALDRATLGRLRAFFLCSPANPQGVVAGLPYLERLIRLAREHRFVVLVDECYAEVYVDRPPPGAMEACARLGGDTDRVLVFHSLSKRSNLPGFRSGFVAGDPALVRDFLALREVGGVAIPEPIQIASAALWRDEAHVEASRALYREKFELAARMLGNRFGFFMPEGGMFLWLEVGDSVEAARRLWAEAGVRVMPGRYMSEASPDGTYPGDDFLRVALVPDLDTTREGLGRIAATLG